MKIPSYPVVAFFALVMASGCSFFQKELGPPDPWEGKIFVGDSERKGLYRGQDKEFVPVDDKRFPDMICMSSSDFKGLIGSYRYFRTSCEIKQ